LPFIAVESKVMREGCKYKGISHHTLKKYMFLLKEYIIFKKIKPELLEHTGHLGAVFDGWSYGDEQYLAIFASYVDKQGIVRNPMLSCSVHEDIDDQTLWDDVSEDDKFFGFTAEDLFDHLMLTFHDEYDLRLPDANGDYTIELTADNLKEFFGFFVCDNCNTNRSIANRTEIPMVGDATHRLNAAVETELIGPKERRNKRNVITAHNSETRKLILKVDKLMGEFKTLKNSSVLRPKCMQMLNQDVKPQRLQDTRWPSKFTLLQKEQKLRPVYTAINWPPDNNVRSFLPTIEEVDQIIEEQAPSC